MKARADRAVAEAIAIIELFFMIGFQSLDAPIIQIVSHPCVRDLKNIHTGLATPPRGIASAASS
jgi:hypothetical protein